MKLSMLLITASACALASVAAAQTPGSSAATSDDAVLGEIVVTARRQSENLQDVPQSVNVVTADALQKLNLQRFQDISAVVPGLTLSSGTSGFATSTSMRGITFDPAGGSPTVAFYLNDAPVESNILFQSLFDVGQIEVLRGPQGTVRGVSAPSGAITVTTRTPNLSDLGGYVDATTTDLQGRNVQGALNVPIIRDLLALRIAGVVDQNDYDGVRSINNAIRPRQVTSAVRTSLRFEPTDLFNANVTYQKLDRRLTAFTAVSGPGNGYNGPAIGPEQRISVQDEPNEVTQHQDVVTANLDSRFAGQHLSYVGSYTLFKINAQTPQDIGNILPGGEVFQTLKTRMESITHEIRLASEPTPSRFFDYSLGAYYYRSHTDNIIGQTGGVLPGGLGSPLGPPDPTAFDSRFTVPLQIHLPGTAQEVSGFGSVTLHLGHSTELTAGARYIDTKNLSSITTRANPTTIALPAAALGLPSCAQGGFSSTYAGVCDVPSGLVPSLPSGVILNEELGHTKHKPWIYNFSLSHRVTDDVLVYVTSGTAWRREAGNPLSLNNAGNDPVIGQLIDGLPEKSRSYEVGLKATFLDDRARINVAVYRQTFDDLNFGTQPVPYLNNNGVTSTVSYVNLTANGDAVVEGFDLDMAFQIAPNWNVTLSGSYADGRFRNAAIPCNDANFDGTPDLGVPTLAQFQAAGRVIALCPSNGSVSLNPYWSATATSEYSRPVSDAVDGFVRGLLTYYPKNARQNVGFVADNYSLLNLYAGLRSRDGGWEVAIFAKNALKTEKTTSRDFAAQDVLGLSSQFGPSGYFLTSTTPRREVGVTAHYAFGSR